MKQKEFKGQKLLCLLTPTHSSNEAVHDATAPDVMKRCISGDKEDSVGVDEVEVDV